MAFQVVSYQVTAAGLEAEAAGLKVEKEEVAILVVVKKEEVAKVAVVKKEEVGWVEGSVVVGLVKGEGSMVARFEAVAAGLLVNLSVDSATAPMNLTLQEYLYL